VTSALGRLTAIAFLATIIACSRGELEPTRDRTVAAGSAFAAAVPARISASPSGASACDRRIRRLLAAEPALPRSAPLDAQRLAVLASAKAEPVVFVRTPTLDPTTCRTARSHIQSLEHARKPGSVLARLLPQFRRQPELGRQVLLREGYLYAETAELARALVERVGPQHLFREHRIWIQRGERVGYAVKNDKQQYVWEDGHERGRNVRLILFDRIGVGVPPPALHRDLRALRYTLHFDRARLRQIAEERLILDLRYGEHWVPTLVRAVGAGLELECEAPAWSHATAATEARMSEARRERALRAWRRSLLARIEHGVPIEPAATPTASEESGDGARTWRSVERSMFRKVAEAIAPGGDEGRWFDEVDAPADDYAPGDVLVGEHQALFVYESDPLSGMPIAVIAARGRPAIRPFHGSEGGTLRRLRPKLEWLESSVPALEDPLLVPPPLVAGPTPE
jgi:hypothetical protein